MLTNSSLSHRYVLIAAFVSLGMAMILHQRTPRPILKISRQESAINLNRYFMKTISLGNKRLLSNILWIQTLMESDQEKYKKHELPNWMYLRFLTIADLDPQFYENYLFGGMYLSIIKDDLTGAADIYEKGLAYFPNDYDLNYHAGFNYYYEIGDEAKGYGRLQLIENHPRFPKGLKFIVRKLKFSMNHNYEDGIQFLTHSLSITKDQVLKKKLKSDLDSLIVQRDLECLNGASSQKCLRHDPHGVPYFQSIDGTWKSKDGFRPYKIFRRGDLKR
jgi:hypothetical protein